ncbi:tetracycline resistance protein [Flavobacterium noncentrifugens]|uniref:Flavin-dependent monooxygenase n=1 Tax=Flavobacterium noncentrifugens TaxID=1128970 RepID=A0A1G8ZGS1_9FLAO|nr:NAD(P)/FAD-dependent oxidoreductase [Flavobacterium noncentrifugens]GEP51938.1 tetracycline resistance protein [Flavobacterium noncentrifugens]SDK14316.1 2-polyprenyl-6-methoxyphenol hydroxylase [Flavobacterium noncentrifugens]
MLLQNKSVAIVGGGPGGLTLARLLQLQGINVKVYERDLNASARVQGSPLDLHETSGLAAIHKTGLFNEFKSNFMPGADKTLIVNERAEIKYSDHDTNIGEDFDNPYFRPEIDRGDLRKILLGSLQPDTVIWNSHFVSMQKQNDGWLLHFKNGNSAFADVVIGSDGANSKIRPYITDIKPFYSGITMLEGNVYQSKESAPIMHSLINGGKIMAFGNAKNILMGQKGGGDLGFYASFKADENWATTNSLDYADQAQMLNWFKSAYPEWSSSWYELFENAAVPFVPRPIYCMPLDQTWKAMPNLTMIGDAAHVMPPFAGEGANMAMRDALELSDFLTSGKYETVHDAISFYENSMRERASEAARESLENGEKMHSENALETMLGFFGGF